MTLGLESLTSELDNKETAFQSLPQSELMKKRQSARTGGLPPSLQDALVAEKVLNDKAAAAREMSLSMQGDPRTVAQQNEAALVNKATAEVAEAVGQANANKMRRQQKNMNRLANMDPRKLGIPRAPVQQRQVMAEGGIVGYQDGGILDKLKDKRTGLYHPGPHMFDSLGQSVYDSVTKNPLDAAGYGLLALASRNPIVFGGKKLAGTKLGKKGLQSLKNFKGLESIKNYFTKAPPFKGYSTQPGITPTPPRILDKRKIGTAAGIGGAGILAANKLLGTSSTPTPTPDFEPMVPRTQQPLLPTGSGQENRGAAEREARQQRALDKFIYMSAGKNLKDMSDRSIAFDQQKFANKIEQDTLKAREKLNEINSASVLQNRLTQVNAEIAAMQEQLYDTPTNEALREAEDELAEDRGNEELLKKVRLLRLESAAELERYADPMGTGDVGLLVQRRQLQARINELQANFMNDPMDSVVARNT